MPALTKQSIINLLIDSPLREPIKINLIDIVNNTKDADLTKVFPTISKELEIFQKATTRRLKLADDTIQKLSSETTTPSKPTLPTEPTNPVDSTVLKVPPLKLPPLPQPKADPPLPAQASMADKPTTTLTPLPAPQPPKVDPPRADTINPTPPPTLTESTEPTAPTESSEKADEAALKEIQKELDALKTDAATDATTPPVQPTV